MAKRSPKPRDTNQRAAAVVAEAVGAGGDQTDEKDAAAVETGRNGGRARAAKLTAKQRSEAARKAAKARWEKTG